jgi:hypothetical protein
VLLGLGFLHWGIVRDHIEAWTFQLTRRTETIAPDPAMRGVPIALGASLPGLSGVVGVVGGQVEVSGYLWYQPSDILQILANQSGRSVNFDTEENLAPESRIILASRIENVTADVAMAILQANRWRLLEQRFPRREYVLIRDEDASQDEAFEGTLISVPVSSTSAPEATPAE